MKSFVLSFACAIVFMGSARAQSPLREKRWLDSVNAVTDSLWSALNNYRLHFPHDSLPKPGAALQKAGSQVAKPGLKMPAMPEVMMKRPAAPSLDITGGYVSYDFSFRSALDTPYLEPNIAQHYINARANATVAGSIPLVITYNGRQSNSRFFRDYNDVRVEFDAARFNALRNKKIRDAAEKQVSQLDRPNLKSGLDQATNKVNALKQWLSGTAVENKLKDARAKLLGITPADSSRIRNDSALAQAASFVKYYDSVKQFREKLSSFSDSLQQQYVVLQRRLQRITKIMANPNLSSRDISMVSSELEKEGVSSKPLQKTMGLLSGVRSFGVGRVLPNHSELSLKNVNIRGVNFEYDRKFYFAFAAGAVDFRPRDFFTAKTQRKPQFVSSARVGVGSRSLTHFYLTAYQGKKQLLSGKTYDQPIHVFGFSVEGQFQKRGHLLTAEVAQSSSPSLINLAEEKNSSSFNLRSPTNRAWSVHLQSNFPRLRARLDASYKRKGINFQSFSSYYTNANTESWQARYDQYLFKRALRLSGAVSKNSFDNSFLPVRYNSSTVYKTAAVSFRKKNWPSIQLSYMPSSQLSEIDGRIYENLFHSLAGSMTHTYPLGLARGMSIVSYNRFFNQASDSGFIYYNARNFYLSQIFQFTSYRATFNLSRSISNDYHLSVMEGTVDANLQKSYVAGLGVKINQLNGSGVRVGFSAKVQARVGKLGELSAMIERAFLPGWKGTLVRNEMCTIHFSRYFKSQE